jgi:hypothetical protein
MDEEHDQLADHLEREADKLESGGDALERNIKETREDWESKKKSEQVAGAMEREHAAPGGLGEEEDSGGADDKDEKSGDG